MAGEPGLSASRGRLVTGGPHHRNRPTAPVARWHRLENRVRYVCTGM